jgi:NADH-quinone oxidoreductase subunit C
LSTTVDGHELAEALRARFGERVVAEDDGAAWVAPEAVADVCTFLRDDADHAYAMLSSVTAVDYVEHFDLVYRLTSIARNATTVLKARVYGREAPSLPSVTGVWVGAELQEREIFDLMGVAFEDHPNLKRLLTWEGFDGHPLRRDYLEPPLPYTWPQGG